MGFLSFLLTTRMSSSYLGCAGPFSPGREPFLEAGYALQGVGAERTVPRAWRGQAALLPPVALSCQQLLGISLGFWNVLHKAPSLAPPLPLFPTPLGAAAPGLEERGQIAGEARREGCGRCGWGTGWHQWGLLVKPRAEISRREFEGTTPVSVT